MDQDGTQPEHDVKHLRRRGAESIAAIVAAIAPGLGDFLIVFWWLKIVSVAEMDTMPGPDNAAGR
jgi:hypothetical protein